MNMLMVAVECERLDPNIKDRLEELAGHCKDYINTLSRQRLASPILAMLNPLSVISLLIRTLRLANCSFIIFLLLRL